MQSSTASRLSLSFDRHSVKMCLTERDVPQLAHIGASSFFIRCLWVTLSSLYIQIGEHAHFFPAQIVVLFYKLDVLFYSLISSEIIYAVKCKFLILCLIGNSDLSFQFIIGDSVNCCPRTLINM